VLYESTIRSIDETKDNIRRSIEEVKREVPRYSQTVTDFQNETEDASVEIADNFLESQKEIINSMQSAWDSVSQSTGVFGGKRAGDNNYWTQVTMGEGMMMLFFFSPQEMTNIYARTIGAMAEAYVASTRMTTNMMFAGLEAARATTIMQDRMQEKQHVLLQTRLEHLSRRQKKKFKFMGENQEEVLVVGVVMVTAALVSEGQDLQSAPLNIEEEMIEQRRLLLCCYCW
jgi:hypothetical protein